VTGLYAILDVDLATSRGWTALALFRIWIDAGVPLIQLRAKTLASGPFLDLADEMARDARTAGAIFIVNDRADIARMSQAAGVHVGQEDLTPAEARTVVGPGALVGVSTHNITQIKTALAGPANYLAIGPVFETVSKDRPDPVVGLAGVRLAADATGAAGRPLVAIGGITLDRAPAVIEAGADAVAVISDLVSADPSRRCREYLKALE
jgi:thiamine-phosphate pyrophosphorylase